MHLAHHIRLSAMPFSRPRQASPISVSAEPSTCWATPPCKSNPQATPPTEVFAQRHRVTAKKDHVGTAASAVRPSAARPLPPICIRRKENQEQSRDFLCASVPLW